MSLRLSCLGCGAALLLIGQPAFGAGSVQLISLEGRVQPAAPIPAVFGGREKGLNLEIKGVTMPKASLHADLLQVAGALAMPLAKNLDLQDGIVLADPSAHPVRATLKFPEVKRRAEILVRLTLVDSQAPTNTVSLGDLRFEVFPATLTKELTDLLAPIPGDSPRLVIFGSGQQLRHGLTGLHAPFEDGGSGLPDRFDANRLYMGELATDEDRQNAQDRSAGARLALFGADETVPPGIYANRSTAGILINVTAPLLDNLADDPRAQLALIKIIHLLSASPTSAN